MTSDARHVYRALSLVVFVVAILVATTFPFSDGGDGMPSHLNESQQSFVGECRYSGGEVMAELDRYRSPSYCEYENGTRERSA